MMKVITPPWAVYFPPTLHESILLGIHESLFVSSPLTPLSVCCMYREITPLYHSSSYQLLHKYPFTSLSSTYNCLRCNKLPSWSLLRIFQETKYSRIPVYSGEIDRISGVVLSKDLLAFVQVMRGVFLGGRYVDVLCRSYPALNGSVVNLMTFLYTRNNYSGHLWV